MEEKDLIQKIKLLQSVEPQEDWVVSNRAKLAFRMEMERKQNLLAGDLFALKGLFASLRSFSPESFFRPVYAVLVAIIMVLGGGAVTVKAAMNSLPGSPLYGVKIGMERALLVASYSDANRTKLQSEMTTRRLEELKAVVESQDAAEDKSAQVAKVVDHLQQQLIADKTHFSNNQASERAEQVKKAIAQAKSSLPTEVKRNLSDKLAQVAETADKTTVEALAAMIAKKDLTNGEKTEILVKFENMLKDKDMAVASIEAAGRSNVVVDKIADKLPISAVLVNQADEAKDLIAKIKAALQKGDFASALEALKALNEIVDGAQKIAENAALPAGSGQAVSDQGPGANASSSPAGTPLKTPLK